VIDIVTYKYRLYICYILFKEHDDSITLLEEQAKQFLEICIQILYAYICM